MKKSLETLKSYFETGDIPTQSQYENLLDSLAMPMIGEMKIVSFATVPSGWAACNGQLLNITEYEVLYSLIGTTYGGDGTTTFALPDLRGKTIVHNDTSYILGEIGGNSENILSESQLPSHNHDVGVLSASHNLTGTVKAFADQGFSDEAENNHFCSGIANSYSDTSSTTNLTLMRADNVQIDGNITLSGTTANTGTATPINNMQPYLVVNTIIALEGIDPLAS
ncbi:phage tail protein [Kordia zhangzhouensis]|uniref:phage tail protein n=1 Tax=Kordia zhangzhouensis TaxID=1620405 RepID=UPI00069A0B82|nr:tail fiber protein [Kordia zhangzhouensis]